MLRSDHTARNGMEIDYLPGTSRNSKVLEGGSEAEEELDTGQCCNCYHSVLRLRLTKTNSSIHLSRCRVRESTE